MKRTYLFMKYHAVYLVVMGLLIFSVSVSATESRRRSRENGRTETDPRKEQMQQEARESASQIDQTLKKLLERTNKNQRPQKEMVEEAVTLLDENKRYANVYDDKQKGQFMLLHAWTDFYQGNLSQALSWSLRACRTYEPACDNWISQVLFSVLSEQRPLKPRPQRERPRRNGRSSRRGDAMVMESATNKPYSERGTLEFDFTGIRDELINERFARHEFKTVAGETVSYAPGKDVLCIFFWQEGPSSVADANEIRSKKINEVQDYTRQELNLDLDLMNGYVAQNTDIKSQRNYFKILANACKDHSDVKFVQVNTDKADTAKKVALELVKDPLAEEAGPLVFAADPQANAAMFMTIQAETPFMVIVGKDGKVRYAGTAADFVPAFILTEFTGVEIDLEKQMQTIAPGSMSMPQMPGTLGVQSMPEMMDPMMMDPMMMQMMQTGTMSKPAQPVVDPNKIPQDPNKPVADPNKPAVDQNAVEVQHSRVPQASEGTTPQTADELAKEYQAGKDLEYADTFIKMAKKGAQSYKKGVDMCRDIIKKYPGTKYEKEARMLLRQVPENKRNLYGITDEELRLP